jgi:hypothetical protein
MNEFLNESGNELVEKKTARFMEQGDDAIMLFK